MTPEKSKSGFKIPKKVKENKSDHKKKEGNIKIKKKEGESKSQKKSKKVEDGPQKEKKAKMEACKEMCKDIVSKIPASPDMCDYTLSSPQKNTKPTLTTDSSSQQPYPQTLTSESTFSSPAALSKSLPTVTQATTQSFSQPIACFNFSGNSGIQDLYPSSERNIETWQSPDTEGVYTNQQSITGQEGFPITSAMNSLIWNTQYVSQNIAKPKPVYPDQWADPGLESSKWHGKCLFT